MSYTIYHTVLILFCFDHDHCVMLEGIMLINRINILINKFVPFLILVGQIF